MSRAAVVVGGSLAGLFATVALTRSGYLVTVLERDELPAEPRPRRGVPQGTQAHVLLHRGLRAAEALLPGITEDLLQAGAAHFDSGRMPWLSEFGWLDPNIGGFPLVSCTRPLLEHLVRERVRQLPGVQIVADARVSGLSRSRAGWMVATRSTVHPADLVIDASGRGSRLEQWLPELGILVPPAEVVDARLGYATRLYRARYPLPVQVGIMIASSPTRLTGGLAMPVENGHWLVMAVGLAEQRPVRDNEQFRPFLSRLGDPALAELVDLLVPVDDVVVHRQTQNRRHAYECLRDWPDGLLVVGDAACAFNPVYGQGITVAACQAEVLSTAMATGLAPSRRIQQRLATVASVPWDIATSQDRRQPTTPDTPTASQRVLGLWTEQLARMAAAGDRAATLTFTHVYHLVAPPVMLLHPILFARAARSVLAPAAPLPRPTVLMELTELHRRVTRRTAA